MLIVDEFYEIKTIWGEIIWATNKERLIFELKQIDRINDSFTFQCLNPEFLDSNSWLNKHKISDSEVVLKEKNITSIPGERYLSFMGHSIKYKNRLESVE